MSSDGIQIALRETQGPWPVWPRVSDWLSAIAISGVIGLGLGLNDRVWPWTQLAALPRTVFWILLSVLIAIQWMVIAGLIPVQAGLIRRTARPVAILVALSPAIGAECAVVAKLMGLTRAPTFFDAWLLFSGTFLQWGVVLVLPLALVATWRAGHESVPLSQAKPETGEQELRDKLPYDVRAPIIALKAEDHYLRVFTEKGEALILMRFADALPRLEDSGGIRVHRSYWVRASAIESLVRDGRRYRIRLANGVSVPVSRACERELKTLVQNGRTNGP